MSASCSQRLLSLWLRRLSTDRIARSREVSLSACHLWQARQCRADRRRRRGGGTARPASPAWRWRRRAPCIRRLQAIAEDAEADAALLEKIADWCLRYTPLVALDAPDGLLLDIGGCAHLYGGEAGAGRRPRRAARASRFRLHASPSPAPSARLTPPPIMANRQATPAARSAALLSPLPLAALRLARRHRRGAGARRLEAHRRHRRSAAQPAHRPLRRRTPAPARPRARAANTSRSIRACRSRLMSPSSASPSRSRARRTCSPSSRGWRRGCSSRWSGAATAPAALELTLFRTDGELRRIAAGCSRPLRDPAQIRALFVERLAALADEFDPGFGFDMARLSVLVAEPAPPEQIGIGGGERRRPKSTAWSIA